MQQLHIKAVLLALVTLKEKHTYLLVAISLMRAGSLVELLLLSSLGSDRIHRMLSEFSGLGIQP